MRKILKPYIKEDTFKIVTARRFFTKLLDTFNTKGREELLLQDTMLFHRLAVQASHVPGLQHDVA